MQNKNAVNIQSPTVERVTVLLPLVGVLIGLSPSQLVAEVAVAATRQDLYGCVTTLDELSVCTGVWHI